MAQDGLAGVLKVFEGVAILVLERFEVGCFLLIGLLAHEEHFHEGGGAYAHVNGWRLEPLFELRFSFFGDGADVFVGPAVLFDRLPPDPSVLFERAEFAVDLAGLGVPEIIERLFENMIDFIAAHAAVAEQSENSVFEHGDFLLGFSIFYKWNILLWLRFSNEKDKNARSRNKNGPNEGKIFVQMKEKC